MLKTAYKITSIIRFFFIKNKVYIELEYIFSDGFVTFVDGLHLSSFVIHSVKIRRWFARAGRFVRRHVCLHLHFLSFFLNEVAVEDSFHERELFAVQFVTVVFVRSGQRWRCKFFPTLENKK